MCHGCVNAAREQVEIGEIIQTGDRSDGPCLPGGGPFGHVPGRLQEHVVAPIPVAVRQDAAPAGSWTT